MSKLVNGYITKFLMADVSVGKDIIDYSEDLDKRGQLTIWESENLYPGQKYIRFRPDDNKSEIQTSCGEISISKDRFTICTQGGVNTYIPTMRTYDAEGKRLRCEAYARRFMNRNKKAA